MPTPDLPQLIADYLPRHGQSQKSRSALAPNLSFGRHQGPAAHDTKSAAVLLLLFQRNDRWFLPLTVRQPHLADHGGQVSFPGGMLEPGEPSDQGALRETDEEIGVAPSQVQILGRLPELYLYNSNYRVAPWIGYSQQSPQFAPNDAEVAELLEIPFSAFAVPESVEPMQIRRGQLQLTAPCFRWEEHRIWGATSMIMAEFSAILRAVQLTAPD